MAFKRKRTAVRSAHYRPPLPPELAVYDGVKWGAPSRDGGGNAWEAAHRAAYMRYEEAVKRWSAEFGHLPVDPSTAPADEPWCGEFDEHDCLGADCLREPTVRDVGFAGGEPRTDDEGL